MTGDSFGRTQPVDETRQVMRKDIRSGWCAQLGRPNHAGCTSLRCGCDCHLRVGAVEHAETQGHDKTSRPRTSGVAAPARGLADREDTTDS